MAITISTNIASLQAQRRLSISSASLANTYQKLSSGQRINRASDDAAGLAIADALKADQRIANVAVRNANDGISTIAIADSGLGEIGNVSLRPAELSEEQSANGVFSTTQRSALSNEFVALGSEIERIANTTEFNECGFSLAVLSLHSKWVLIPHRQRRSHSLGYRKPWQRLDWQLRMLRHSPSPSTEVLSPMVSKQHGAHSTQFAQRYPPSLQHGVHSVPLSHGCRLLLTTYRLRERTSLLLQNLEFGDVDVASEAAELTRLGILQQAGASVLAQANQQPASGALVVVDIMD